MSTTSAVGRLTLGDVTKLVKKRHRETETEATLISRSSLCSTELQGLDRLTGLARGLHDPRRWPLWSSVFHPLPAPGMHGSLYSNGEATAKSLSLPRWWARYRQMVTMMV